MSAYRDLGKLLFGNLLSKIVGVLSTLVLVRILSKDQLVIVPLCIMSSNIASNLLDFGISPYFVRSLPALFREDREAARSLLATGTAITFSGMATMALIVFLLRNTLAHIIFGETGAGWMISIMCLGFLPYLIAKTCDYVLLARAQFGAISTVQSLDAILRPTFILSLFFLFGSVGLVSAFVLSQTALMAVYLFLVRDLFRGPRPRRYPVRKLLADTIPFYFESYLWYLRGDGDYWLVNIFLGTAALAEYYIASTVYGTVVMLFTSLDKVVVERLGRERGTPELLSEKTEALHITISRFVLPGILWMTALTPLGIVVLAGPAYANSAAPAVVLMLVALTQFAFLPVDRSMFVGTPTRFRLFKTAVETGVFVSVSAALAPFFGMSGFATGRLGGQLAGGLFGVGVLRRRLNLSLEFREAIKAILTAVPGTVLILVLTPPVTSALQAILTAAVVSVLWFALFFALSWFFNRQLLDAGWQEIGRVVRR